MPKALSPRPGGKARPKTAGAPNLPRDISEEVARVTRPTGIRDAQARLARAIDLLERGDAGAAVTEAQKAKKISPRSTSVREVLGLALYGQERWQEALAELKAYRRMTEQVDQNHIMADCLRGLGRPADAIPLIDEELKAKGVSNEAKAEAVIVAASAFADQGRFAEALAYLGRARTRDDVAEDYTLRLWYVKGDILARAGRKEEAATEFKKVMRHDVGAFDAAERLAELG
jgi:tetratricopeptide (TPR) repeat protein